MRCAANNWLKTSAVHNYYIKRELRQKSSVVINHSETMSVTVRESNKTQCMLEKARKGKNKDFLWSVVFIVHTEAYESL